MKDTQSKNHTSLPWFGIPKLIPFLRPHKTLFIVMVGTGLVVSIIDIILPLFQSYAIDNFIGLSTLEGLGLFIAFYVGFLLLQVGCNFVSSYVSSKVELLVNRDLRHAAFSHLQTLAFSYFNQNSVGYVHARVMSDTSRIGELVSWSVMDGVWNGAYMIGAMVVMLVINWKLALLVLAVMPLATILISLFQKKLVRLNRKTRELNSTITGDFNEGITGAKTIKSLTVEDKMDVRFRADTAAMKKISVHTMHTRAMLGSIVVFSSFIALALVLWRGGKLTMEGLIALGTLSVFMSYAQGIMEPIQWVVDAVSNLISAQVNIERLDKLLTTESDVSDSPEVVAKYGDSFSPKRENWEPLDGTVDFKDVSFRYPDGDEYVLEHFNLHVPAGQNVAIVGETGAGKSTLVNLVCRFYEPTEGQVLIDGRDARERSQLWLHAHIGYVLQSPHLFSGSVRENLLYGNPNATDEEIWAALDTVSARDVVERMDKGLDSEVGEAGDLLSTGEKQLLSFARALLADPRILVLDEATSSIDTMTEQRIQEAIDTVIRGRTSFVIAHRLSTVQNADIILVVKNGKIVERGTHKELLAQKGYYFLLYTRQHEEEEEKKVF